MIWVTIWTQEDADYDENKVVKSTLSCFFYRKKQKKEAAFAASLLIDDLRS